MYYLDGNNNSFELVAGRTFTLVVPVVDDDGSAYVWDGETLALHVKQNPDDSSSKLSVSGTRSAAGVATFEFTAANTNGWAPGTYWYDISINTYTLIACTPMFVLPSMG